MRVEVRYRAGLVTATTSAAANSGGGDKLSRADVMYRMTRRALLCCC